MEKKDIIEISRSLTFPKNLILFGKKLFFPSPFSLISKRNYFEFIRNLRIFYFDSTSFSSNPNLIQNFLDQDLSLEVEEKGVTPPAEL